MSGLTRLTTQTVTAAEKEGQMTMTVTMFCRYIPLALFSLAMDAQNFLTAPLVVLFARRNDKGEWWLPRWLSWWQTPDNPLDGDSGWKEEHRLWRYDDDVDSNPFKRWVNQFLWLYRNSMYGFQISVMGFVVAPAFVYIFKGDQGTTDRQGQTGIVYRALIQKKDRKYFQLYAVWPWGDTGYCFRLNLGWKLWATPKPGQAVQLVCSCTPFKKLRKGEQP
jgi:hypothetical protein